MKINNAKTENLLNLVKTVKKKKVSVLVENVKENLSTTRFTFQRQCFLHLVFLVRHDLTTWTNQTNSHIRELKKYYTCICEYFITQGSLSRLAGQAMWKLLKDQMQTVSEASEIKS